MALAVASPVQLWGPLKVILPASLTLPVKPLKGAANDSAHAVSVTVKLMPTSVASQCAVTLHVPLTSGQPALGAPALPALPPLPASAPEPPDELELQALSSRTAAHKTRSIQRWYRPLLPAHQKSLWPLGSSRLRGVVAASLDQASKYVHQLSANRSLRPGAEAVSCLCLRSLSSERKGLP